MKNPAPLPLLLGALGALVGLAFLARRAAAGPSQRAGGAFATNSSSSSSSGSAPPARVLSTAELERRYGPLPWTPVAGDDSAIAIDPDWKRDNLVTVEIPQLRGVKGAPASGRVEVHRKVADRLVALFEAWERAGLLPQILTWDGLGADRRTRGRPTVSRHAYRIAFDVNARWNPLGAEPAPAGTEGSVRELVPLAEAHGFAWGGNFRTRKDGMHFEASE